MALLGNWYEATWPHRSWRPSEAPEPAIRVARPKTPAKDRQPIKHRTHGLRSTYNDGCRCPDCKGAERTYQRDRYRARVGAR